MVANFIIHVPAAIVPRVILNRDRLHTADEGESRVCSSRRASTRHWTDTEVSFLQDKICKRDPRLVGAYGPDTADSLGKPANGQRW